jgi:hypothetical protein
VAGLGGLQYRELAKLGGKLGLGEQGAAELAEFLEAGLGVGDHLRHVEHVGPLERLQRFRGCVLVFVSVGQQGHVLFPPNVRW